MKVIIMRGVSGSGKSTRARELAKAEDSSIICSADNYFMVDGKYNFNPAELGKAHGACFDAFVSALKNSTPLVIVDNTNTKEWEYKRYVDAANEYGYQVQFETVGDFSPESLELYAERNVHGVPLAVIKKQAGRFEH